MSQITLCAIAAPFTTQKSKKFLGRGHSPSPDPSQWGGENTRMKHSNHSYITAICKNSTQNAPKHFLGKGPSPLPRPLPVRRRKLLPYTPLPSAPLALDPLPARYRRSATDSKVRSGWRWPPVFSQVGASGDYNDTWATVRTST